MIKKFRKNMINLSLRVSIISLRQQQEELRSFLFKRMMNSHLVSINRMKDVKHMEVKKGENH